MPKIIPDLRDSIIEEAKLQIRSHGYDNLKIRNLALNCNIAIGTVYNYFWVNHFFRGIDVATF